MSKENEIEVNGVKYIRKDAVKSSKEFNGKTKIVILQRGWVIVGKFERKGSDCKLHNASVIRNWGTTKGLGELAEGGKTAKTILEKCFGVVEFDYLTVVATVACEESKWSADV